MMRSRPLLPVLMMFALAACSSGPVVTAHDATRLPTAPMLPAAERAALTASGPVGLRQASSGHWVSGYVENASQVDAVRALGVRTVISLVPAGERPEIDEQMLVTSAGLRFLSVPVAGPADLTRGQGPRPGAGDLRVELKSREALKRAAPREWRDDAMNLSDRSDRTPRCANPTLARCAGSRATRTPSLNTCSGAVNIVSRFACSR